MWFCTYPKTMEQRNPGLIIKCRALRREIWGRGGFVHAPLYKCTDILNKGKFSFFHRKLNRGKKRGADQMSPLVQNKDMLSLLWLITWKDIRNCLKWICHPGPLRTVSTFSIAKFGQIKKKNVKNQLEERTAAINACCVGWSKIQCICCLTVLNTLSLHGMP